MKLFSATTRKIIIIILKLIGATKVLEIIKYINPKTGETGSAIQMFEEEKNSIQEVCTLLECFKKNISDGRDLYEFDFCQKFLKSLTTLSDLSEISGKIDELVFESIPDMVSFYGIGQTNKSQTALCSKRLLHDLSGRTYDQSILFS